MELVQQHNFTSFVRVVFATYRANFVVLYFILALPTSVVGGAAMYLDYDYTYYGENQRLAALLRIAYGIVIFIVQGATALAISDICRQNRPSVLRSYARLLRIRWRAPVGYMLAAVAVLVIVLASILLNFDKLPDSFFSEAALWTLALLLFLFFIVSTTVRLGLVLTIATLEDHTRSALRRSYELTKGVFWRNLGFFLAILAIGSLLAAPIFFLLDSLALALWETPSATPVSKAALALVMELLTNVPTPLYHIAITILYYDCRVRFECYESGVSQEVPQ